LLQQAIQQLSQVLETIVMFRLQTQQSKQLLAGHLMDQQMLQLLQQLLKMV